MKRFFIKTLGCKVNQCESEAIANTLAESDRWMIAGDHGRVDIVIVNTCSVTRKAAMQSRQAIRRAIRDYPEARVVVTGCHAQTAPEELAAIDGIDRVVGNRDKHRIAVQILDGRPWNDGRGGAACRDRVGLERFDPLPGVAHGNRTRPFLKIQDGCNAFCTYCIVPHARGRSRSLPVDDVMQQIATLGRMGYREVVLTGIHIGCYGQDLEPAVGLIDLLGRIRDAGSMDRVRISSIEPAELSDDIIDLAVSGRGAAGRLCPHFHLPLQSGDDAILKRMHRPYDREFFRQRVLTILDRLPDAAIGVDVLCGFPGETDEAFENTFALIQSLPVAYLHVFPFSARRGTPAFSFNDQIGAAVIKRRCERMRRLGARKRRAFYGRVAGSRCVVLVEEARGEKKGRLKGLTDNYIPVSFDGPESLCNTFQQVDILGMSADGHPEGRSL